MPIALVTGADGFIGSRLVELLVKKGYKIKALSQYNSFNNWGWIEDIECRDKIEILTGARDNIDTIITLQNKAMKAKILLRG